MTTLFGTAGLSIGMRHNSSRLQLFDGPLDISWHHCAITSDFVSELFAACFHPGKYKHARHDIGYLVNELVENAVKFRRRGEIIIEASTDMDNFLLKVSNDVDAGAAVEFQSLLSEITGADPAQLLIDRIERKANQNAMSGSGLGLLTLMSDYNVRLAWFFNDCEDGGVMRVDILASLPIGPLATQRDR